ncbi:Hsp20/alpha crystallin family protein [Spirosoma endophyticum]|uniref:HSP20 family protein n=1 Tax=Spirosoma endophyticum TaxID=662367 RepID=A0A1I1F6B5_9BACT|nr:Hsp20/alpha crystallin family protein [Spirosoma endophyticum]SFB93248.1 HSP20 family protein [Spirosoma endophyticum]
MYNKHAFESGNKGGCGPMGRGGFGGPFGRGKFGGFFGRHAGGFHQKPPVNIEETDTEFTISLFAAGLAKENVTLSVKDDVLAISYQGTDQPADDQPATAGKYTYQEHSNRSFERSFKLNDKVITESISASYADGILKVTLPKNPATNKPAQTITVS